MDLSFAAFPCTPSFFASLRPPCPAAPTCARGGGGFDVADSQTPVRSTGPPRPPRPPAARRQRPTNHSARPLRPRPEGPVAPARPEGSLRLMQSSDARTCATRRVKCATRRVEGMANRAQQTVLRDRRHEAGDSRAQGRGAGAASSRLRGLHHHCAPAEGPDHDQRRAVHEHGGDHVEGVQHQAVAEQHDRPG